MVFSFTSCDEDGNLTVTLFAFEWKKQSPDINLASLSNQLENPTSALSAGSIEYNNNRPDQGNLNSNKINAYGSPPESLEILITREPRIEESGAKGFKIYIVGTIEEGRTYTNESNSENYAEMYFVPSSGQGTRVYSTEVGDDTFFELTIDQLNTNTRRIGGSFFFALRDETDPNGKDAVIGFNGSFTWIY